MSTPSSPQSFRQIIGIPPSSVSVQDSTLIIIDAQNEYASGSLQIDRISESRKVISDLLARYRQGNGRNIVHVLHKTPPGAPVFTQGTQLAEPLEELTPISGEKLVTKQFPSSFAQTDLHEYLGSLGDVGKKIVLVGYMAHVCISTTARAGNELGYDVVVVSDAVGDRHIPGVEASTLTSVSLRELEDAFATVVSARDITA
ncbi:Isochorismatase-like protein [Aspergillus varians]